MRILIVEDEADLRNGLAKLFREEGYAVDAAANGVDGLQKAKDFEYDAIVLDYMMPGMDGREVLRRLRSVKRTPVMMLTARNSVEDRVVGLDLGADDYLAKPFVQQELLARLRALVRRNHSVGGATFTIGGVVIDTVSRRVTKAGQPEALTGREYSLLEYLAHRRGAGVRVVVTTGLVEGQAELTVADNGRGIPAENLEHIFERFRRIDPEGSRHAEGAGLGLAIVKQAVEAHGGTIAVTSEVGRGTTFRVRLPLAV